MAVGVKQNLRRRGAPGEPRGLGIPLIQQMQTPMGALLGFPRAKTEVAGREVKISRKLKRIVRGCAFSDTSRAIRRPRR